MKQKQIFIFGALALLAAFVVATLFYTAERGAEQNALVEQNRARLAREGAPTFGPATAKVEIVEFLDPACETCKAFYPFVKQLMAAEPGKIRLVVRFTPFHPGSEEMVKILEAAHRQGKFAETLEAMFAAQDMWVINHTAHADRFTPYLQNLGLDLERLRQDMASPEIAQIIQRDLADAAALGVTKTPEFFVNGKPMPSFGFEPLHGLVSDAVKAAY